MLKGSSQFNRVHSPLNQAPSFKPPNVCFQLKHIVSTYSSQKKFPQQLLSEVAFEPSKKCYFRTIEELPPNQRAVSLGWRIIQLSLEQVDLGLFCFSMLQSSVNFPFKIFAANREEEQKGNQVYKDIWIHFLIVQPKDQDTKGLEYAIYKLYVVDLLPRIRKFCEKYINWTYMSSSEYEDTNVINKFKKQIVEVFQLKVQEFRTNPNIP